MAKIKLVVGAIIEETFSAFLISQKTKRLPDFFYHFSIHHDILKRE